MCCRRRTEIEKGKLEKFLSFQYYCKDTMLELKTHASLIVNFKNAKIVRTKFKLKTTKIVSSNNSDFETDK